MWAGGATVQSLKTKQKKQFEGMLIVALRCKKTFPFLVLDVLPGWGVVRPVWTAFQLFPKWRVSLIEDLLTLDDCLITGATFIFDYLVFC